MSSGIASLACFTWMFWSWDLLPNEVWCMTFWLWFLTGACWGWQVQFVSTGRKTGNVIIVTPVLHSAHEQPGAVLLDFSCISYPQYEFWNVDLWCHPSLCFCGEECLLGEHRVAQTSTRRSWSRTIMHYPCDQYQSFITEEHLSKKLWWWKIVVEVF
jgi:hypothetical protein